MTNKIKCLFLGQREKNISPFHPFILSVNFFPIPTDILVLLNGHLLGKFLIGEQHLIPSNVTSVDIPLQDYSDSSRNTAEL